MYLALAACFRWRGLDRFEAPDNLGAVVVRNPNPKPFLCAWRAFLGGALASAALICLQVSQIMAEEPRVEGTQGSVKTGQYAGSAVCESCHEDEYRQWQSSHHKLAERKPNASRDQAAFAVGRAVLSGDHSVIPR